MDKQNQQTLPALQLKGITKIYGQGDTQVHALKGVDLSFRKNEFVSILGPSGCGKTTLLNIIGGLDRYTSGDLIIDGKSTTSYTDKDWDAYRNNSIGFVFQNYNLIPHQTVLGNVELALELSGVSKKQRKARAYAILEKVGLKGLEHKRPNQLSGGQMQRVAIARALINDPDIILADEPTGALDSETSIQVMNLLKEIASDRLVIMVTHNGELAQDYSTRIIRLVDGLVVGDTDPFTPQLQPQPKRQRKPKMGFKTAFLLSLKNLFTKKTRTIITSIAGSIGIIGVALILALSNGFNAYMARMQTDSLASYPLTISENSVDMSSFTDIYEGTLKEKYPQLDNVLVHQAFKNLVGMLKSNDLSDASEQGFLAHLNKIDKQNYYAIQYDYGFSMNDYLFVKTNVNGVQSFSSVDDVTDIIGKAFENKLTQAMNGMMSTSMIADMIPTFQQMPDKALITEQYELLYGDWPTFEKQDYNQVVLVVDQFNGVSDITAMLLGYVSGQYDDVKNTFSFDYPENGIALTDFVGENSKPIYLAKNSLMYSKLPISIPDQEIKVYSPLVVNEDNAQLEKINVVGIIRAKEGASGLLESGIAYTPALTEHIIEVNKESQVAVDARTDGAIALVNPNSQYGYEGFTARMLAGVDTPSAINIYAKDFDSKELIKQHIDSWNKPLDEDDAKYIHYSDMMTDMFSMLSTMVNAVSYVLIAFTSISLVVSSVMIGIITYTSVMERTKEIGVLRSLGASKREIKRVFNAETFIIGLCAGLIGVGVTYLLSIPINLILASLIPDVGALANLDITSAIVLTVLSVCLTLIAGLVPASIAAKKDPVNALRTE